MPVLGDFPDEAGGTSLTCSNCRLISATARSTSLDCCSLLARLSACLASVVTISTGGTPSVGGGTGEEKEGEGGIGAEVSCSLRDRFVEDDDGTSGG